MLKKHFLQIALGVVLLCTLGCDQDGRETIPNDYELSSFVIGSSAVPIQEYNRIAKTADGGAAVVYHALHPINYENGIEDLTVRKYGAQGEEQWIYRTKETYSSFGLAIYQCANGELIVAGSKAKGQFFAEGADPYLIRLTADGKLVWKKTYPGLWYDQGISVIETTTNAIIVYVRTLSEDYLMKVDANGDEQWRQPLAHDGCEGYWNLHPTNDGGFFAAGPNVKQYDAEGQMIWCYSPTADANFSPSDSWSFQSIVPITNQEVLAFGNVVRGGRLATACLNQLQTEYVLALVNDTGSPEPPTTYPFDYNNYPKSIDQTTDGGYILLGDAIDIQPCDSFGEFPKSHLIKIGSGGNLAWDFVLGLGTPIAAREIAPDYFVFMTDNYSPAVPGGHSITVYFFRKLS